MSLLTDNFEPFVYMEQNSEPDGEGAFDRLTYSEGAEFLACARPDSSAEAEIAGAKGVVSLYTITVGRAVRLEAKKIIKRLSDSKLFRITSDGDDNKTPTGAGLDMRQVRAEEWVMPND